MSRVLRILRAHRRRHMPNSELGRTKMSIMELFCDAGEGSEMTPEPELGTVRELATSLRRPGRYR